MTYGDTPCQDCGTKENPVWFCDNVFWNEVMGDQKTGNEERGKIICPLCFMKRSEEKYDIQAWRMIPEFDWAKK